MEIFQDIWHQVHVCNHSWMQHRILDPFTRLSTPKSLPYGSGWIGHLSWRWTDPRFWGLGSHILHVFADTWIVTTRSTFFQDDSLFSIIFCSYVIWIVFQDICVIFCNSWSCLMVVFTTPPLQIFSRGWRNCFLSGTMTSWLHDLNHGCGNVFVETSNCENVPVQHPLDVWKADKLDERSFRKGTQSSTGTIELATWNLEANNILQTGLFWQGSSCSLSSVFRRMFFFQLRWRVRKQKYDIYIYGNSEHETPFCVVQCW